MSNTKYSGHGKLTINFDTLQKVDDDEFYHQPAPRTIYDFPERCPKCKEWFERASGHTHRLSESLFCTLRCSQRDFDITYKAEVAALVRERKE